MDEIKVKQQKDRINSYFTLQKKYFPETIPCSFESKEAYCHYFRGLLDFQEY
jgi:hypothetical protein